MNAQLLHLLGIDQIKLDALKSATVWKSCEALTNLFAKRKDQASMDFIRRKLHELVFGFSVLRPLGTQVPVNPMGLQEIGRITPEALTKGWTEEELVGCNKEFRGYSLGQLFITGSTIVSIDEEKIVLQTPTGSLQNVWHPRSYRPESSHQSDTTPADNPAVPAV